MNATEPLSPSVAWQPLPARAARLDALQGLLGAGLIPGAPLAGAWYFFGLPGGPAAAAAVLALCAVAGAVLAWRRVRRTRWRLDADGLGLRRDLWWQQETRVPLSRVQHLDLRRGPLQRQAGLATLVVHTAGSRFAAVVVPGLDHTDAERLRDTLARQLDQDADAL
ncbi:PH domain-containing protein [Stenotrophomonas sp. C3(2023)]|uniref:PH domain-containing protein n=1 Tax=Stenotrophomonas sp. C3(2023) TaxID=3080277 RepID=UPI00293C694A|nr:PH domain-containing protein [Stenotrophomonas sp. C3(2023)]MDV3469858.1 PH domain-containing protein [Stenotrophomonas sp. C3(2023)]